MYDKGLVPRLYSQNSILRKKFKEKSGQNIWTDILQKIRYTDGKEVHEKMLKSLMIMEMQIKTTGDTIVHWLEWQKPKKTGHTKCW